MPEHLSSEDLERFRKREIPPSQLVQCYDHLAVCEACRTQVGEAVKPGVLRTLLTELGTEEFDHLEYERVAAYVDGLLGESEREVGASHLEVCVACRERAQELRVFRAELAGDPETRSAAAERSTFWQKLVRFWRVPVHWVPVQLAATVLIIGLCVWAMFVLRARIANLEAERNRLKQANEELEGQRDTVAELRARLESLQAENETLRSQGLIALNDAGNKVTLDKQGVIGGLGVLPENYQRAVKSALIAQRFDTPADLAALIGDSAAVVRGATPGVAFALIGPVGTVVEGDHPVFRWRELKGATEYVVTVFDSSFNRLVASEPLSGTEWVSTKSLERGRTYSWQVTATRGDEKIKSPTTPAPEARFRVLYAIRAAEIERAKQVYGTSHLLIGLLSVRAGLLDDAEREFEVLVKANPESETPQKLLQRVRALRRR